VVGLYLTIWVFQGISLSTSVGKTRKNSGTS